METSYSYIPLQISHLRSLLHVTYCGLRLFESSAGIITAFKIYNVRNLIAGVLNMINFFFNVLQKHVDTDILHSPDAFLKSRLYLNRNQVKEQCCVFDFHLKSLFIALCNDRVFTASIPCRHCVITAFRMC